ncbi:transcription factor IIIA, putative [Ixodes scapularis]|uniref:Transcription factor IIIA, putative n=1 Tax=Ixodes scapularis TaxID=6945 RepID=B7PVM3_IXOSC|nr:transcription factor IIIA, putative [Ixodes scapularis]|eukprot:XP_002408231.1 transcription factor IIIA, putative [Ixodes scapularis]
MCNFSYYNENRVMRHRVNHVTPPQLQCHVCGLMEFWKKTALVEPREDAHGAEAVCVPPVPVCVPAQALAAGPPQDPLAQLAAGVSIASDEERETDEDVAEDKTLRLQLKGFYAFNCDVCGFSVHNENSMTRHHMHHAKPPLPECRTCGQTFPSFALLAEHVRCHYSTTPYRCDVCSARFKSTGHLKDHLRNHSGERPFGCQFCGKSFGQKTGLAKHVAMMHGGRRPYACHLCPQVFKRRGALMDHIGAHELQKAAREHALSRADELGAAFRGAPAAKSGVGASSEPGECLLHLLADDERDRDEDAAASRLTGIHTFACDACGYTTQNENLLTRHRRNHIEPELLQCHVCNEEFAQITQLEAHLPSHLTAKPYMCDVCCARFRYGTHLKDHLRVHTGERPFVCETCGKTFVHRTTWVHHMKTHTGDKPFACPLCPLAFVSKRLLQDHLKLHAS